MQWHQGIRIHVAYREEGLDNNDPVDRLYSGVVVSLSDSAHEEWPHSPWEALQVEWDETGEEAEGISRIGPWEARPVESMSFTEACRKIPAPGISEEACTHIISRIGSYLDENPEVREAFEFTVDSEVFPDYYGIVQVPMYIDLIRRRLQNGYYRQVLGRILCNIICLAALKYIPDRLYDRDRISH